MKREAILGIAALAAVGTALLMAVSYWPSGELPATALTADGPLGRQATGLLRQLADAQPADRDAFISKHLAPAAGPHDLSQLRALADHLRPPARWHVMRLDDWQGIIAADLRIRGKGGAVTVSVMFAVDGGTLRFRSVQW